MGFLMAISLSDMWNETKKKKKLERQRISKASQIVLPVITMTILIPSFVLVVRILYRITVNQYPT